MSTSARRHRFAEHSRQQGSCLSVGAIGQPPQLWMDESSHGELVTGHHSGYGYGRYVVSNGHYGIRCSAITPRIVK